MTDQPIKREFENGEPVKYFVGIEVEHTVLHGEETLFVVGVQDPSDVVFEARKLDVKHVYLGANKSFHMTEEWEQMVDELLSEGFWVTLDYPVRLHKFIMRTMGNHLRKSRFIPMISVELPKIEIKNYNTTLKMDDLDIYHSNPGIWCHSLHDLMDRSVFNDWDAYDDDEGVG